MSDSVKQDSFAGDGFGPSRPVAVELPIDFWSMPLGSFVAADVEVVACPVCSRHCAAQGGKYVHRGTVIGDGKAARFEAVEWCTAERGTV